MKKLTLITQLAIICINNCLIAKLTKDSSDKSVNEIDLYQMNNDQDFNTCFSTEFYVGSNFVSRKLELATNNNYNILLCSRICDKCSGTYNPYCKIIY